MWEHHPGENSAVGRQARSLRHQAFDDCRQPWKRIATFEYLIQFPFLGPKCVFIIITFLTSVSNCTACYLRCLNLHYSHNFFFDFRCNHLQEFSLSVKSLPSLFIFCSSLNPLI